MPRNIEIKARVADPVALYRSAQALATQGPEHLAQDDSFFRCHHGRLKLRDFGDGHAELIACTRPDAPGPKASAYRIAEVADPERLRAVLGAALGESGRVVKSRTVFLIGRTRVHLDHVAGLGDFVELEVVLRDGEAEADGQAEAERLMQALHIEPGQLISGAYVDLQRAFTIRPCTDSDWALVWPLLQATFKAGDTYAFDPDSSEAEIHRAWIELPATSFVACAADGRLLGTYFIKANQTGLGAHVCNCGYVVAPAARGQGVASAMCVHSQAEAVAMGFRAMQFNFVAATNETAVRLWKKLGFEVVGTLPGAFAHRQFGFVDAFVMFKTLVSDRSSMPR